MSEGARIPPSLTSSIYVYAHSNIYLDICPADVVRPIAASAASTTRLIGDTASVHTRIRILSGSVWNSADSYSSPPFRL